MRQVSTNQTKLGLFKRDLIYILRYFPFNLIPSLAHPIFHISHIRAIYNNNSPSLFTLRYIFLVKSQSPERKCRDVDSSRDTGDRMNNDAFFLLIHFKRVLLQRNFNLKLSCEVVRFAESRKVTWIMTLSAIFAQDFSRQFSMRESAV